MAKLTKKQRARRKHLMRSSLTAEERAFGIPPFQSKAWVDRKNAIATRRGLPQYDHHGYTLAKEAAEKRKQEAKDAENVGDPAPDQEAA